jgi:hypothetical protein
MRALVLAWEPDWGGVISEAYRDLRDEPVGPPYTGWLMYFAHHWGVVPPLPSPVRVEPVEDKGTLVILTPERLTPSNPEHVALARRVQNQLEERGLLRLVIQPRPAPT